MRQFFLALGCFVFVMFSASIVYAQTQTPAAINPLTGPSFPCPKPEDPLAQLFCMSPQLALLDMQFVKTYDALHQQIGPSGDEALRQEDIQLELAIRSRCGIAMPQGNSPTPPPPAPPGSDQCVIAAYQQQIAIWKSRLYGAAAEEANRSIPDQIALQGRLQALGFLPAQAQLDSVFGTGTRAAIIQWQTSVGREPTGLLGDADAQALLADMPPAPTVPPAPTTDKAPIASVEEAWKPYISDAACMSQHGFSLQTFVQQNVPPTDPIASQAIAQCASNSTPPSSTSSTTASTNTSSNTNSQLATQPTATNAEPVAPTTISIWGEIYNFFAQIFDEIGSFFYHLFNSGSSGSPQPTTTPDMLASAEILADQDNPLLGKSYHGANSGGGTCANDVAFTFTGSSMDFYRNSSEYLSVSIDHYAQYEDDLNSDGLEFSRTIAIYKSKDYVQLYHYSDQGLENGGLWLDGVNLIPGGGPLITPCDSTFSPSPSMTPEPSIPSNMSVATYGLGYAVAFGNIDAVKAFLGKGGDVHGDGPTGGDIVSFSHILAYNPKAVEIARLIDQAAGSSPPIGPDQDLEPGAGWTHLTSFPEQFVGTFCLESNGLTLTTSFDGNGLKTDVLLGRSQKTQYVDFYQSGSTFKFTTSDGTIQVFQTDPSGSNSISAFWPLDGFNLGGYLVTKGDANPPISRPCQ